MEIDIQGLEQCLEYHFSGRKLVRQALTHPSHEHERTGSGDGDYQRLEFLGDAVLGMVLAETLYTRFPEANEGDLSRFRSQMADQETLAGIARQIGLGRFIRLGKGESQDSGHDKDSILADVLEALIAAIYLEDGLEAVRRMIVRLFANLLDAPESFLNITDPKSELQELLSARRMPAPHYRLQEETGPPHDRLFFFQVLVEGKVAGEGKGRSKKSAQQAAAAQALQHLDTTADRAND
jgi:ribonuclease-3